MADEKTIEHDVDIVGMYWQAHKEEVLDLANAMFMGFVEPAFLFGKEPHLTREEISPLFSEWLLFEFPGVEGRSPFSWFVTHHKQTGRRLNADQLIRLRQIERTQFFSRFEIHRKDLERGTCTLIDVCDDRRYEVADSYLCSVERWRDGTIAQRIAKVDGKWYHVGKVYLYDIAEPRYTALDGPGMIHPEDLADKPEVMLAGFYLRLLRDTIGIDGRYRKSASTLSA